ncbi:MAG: sulfotransferase [Alcanivorax sp.]|uniref:tetratricopeptide repeat-containing sulfotransferase family protein n=1 Tax=Alcanivorax sp. TaxID=1872427 RepID=UPI00262AFC30|nr:sulfotransferase [Alcanivorax sp.]MDF1724268.1 sulfotransferase [Alcanivorax sp.]
MQETITVEQLRGKIVQLCRSGQLAKAIELLTVLAARGQLDYPCLYTVVDTALAGDNARAVTFLVQSVARQRKGDWQAWELRYKLCRAKAHWSEVLVTLKKIQKLASTPMAWVWLAKAEAFERLLRPQEAMLALDEMAAMESVTLNSRYWYMRAATLLQLKERQAVIDTIAPALESMPEDQYVASAWKVVGKALDTEGSYEAAFTAFKKANDILAKGQNIAENPLRRRIEVYRALYNKEWVAEWNEYPADEEPVFLVGFPRSGTTLLEQVLDAHKDIQTLEEPPTMAGVMRELAPWLNAMALKDGAMSASQNWKQQWLAGFRYMSRLSESQINLLRNTYFQVVDERLQRVGRKRLIDKMPLNSVEIGLILRLFPNAKFIVAVRHPCDSVLSGYMQPFQINESMANFVNLEAGATLYKNVMHLLWQYEEVFGLGGRIHTIRYEDIVADLEGEASKLLAFLGLKWDESVLSFDQHARQRKTLATPSYHGVTQQIYRSSVERWRHYSQWLEPVLPHFREAAERYGYDLA